MTTTSRSHVVGLTTPCADDRAGDRGRCVELITGSSGAAPGELLLSAPPFAKLLDPSLWSERCHHCFRSADELSTPTQRAALSRCGRCRAVYYCSRACQQKDWRPDHHAECSRLAQLLALRLRKDQVSDVLLLGRVLRRAESATDVSPSQLVWFADEDDVEARLLSQLAIKLGFLDGDTPVETAERMLRRFRCNNMSITDATLRAIGAGCYPLGAMVNHSCSPKLRGHTSEMQFRALRAVAPDEELTHAYVDMALPRDTRQRRLKARYGFDCQCPRCRPSHKRKQEEDNTDDRLLEADADGVTKAQWSLERRSKVDMLLQRLEASTQIDAVENVLQELQRELHPLNTHILQALSRLFSLQMEDAQVERAAALKTGELIREVYDKVYPANHPMRGLHLFTLGDVSVLTNQRTQAARLYAEARAILRVTHGPMHSLVQLLEARCNELHPTI
ncbi:hypothetical protein PINS_up011466 [Pythium insidiosum]|nr:hypothetical protein PINS_up011466 [Pythium insidiosum]